MSLNDAGDYRKIVPVDEGVVQQVKQIAFNHMKNGYGVSDGEDISKVIRDYTLHIVLFIMRPRRYACISTPCR